MARRSAREDRLRPVLRKLISVPPPPPASKADGNRYARATELCLVVFPYTLVLGPVARRICSCGRKPLRQGEEERTVINGVPPKLRLAIFYGCGESRSRRSLPALPEEQSQAGPESEGGPLGSGEAAGDRGNDLHGDDRRCDQSAREREDAV